MQKTRALLLCLLLICPTLAAQQLRVRFTQVFAIGDDEDAPAEYLLAGPRAVAVDSRHRLYVADGINPEIRLYDHDGTFIRRVGARGQGPGEMQEVAAMTVDPDDALVVADRYNKRITRFAADGRTFETFPIIENEHVDVCDVLALADGRYALHYKVARTQPGRDPRPWLIHLYDHQFQMLLESHVSAATFYDLDAPFHRALLSSCGARFALGPGGQLYMAPRFYAGKLLRYDVAAGWKEQQLNGHAPGYPPYRLLDPEDTDRLQQATLQIYGRSGKFAVVQNSRSFGLFPLQNGYLMHLTLMGQEKKQVFGVEMFDETGRYLGYGPLRDIEAFDEQDMVAFYILATDGERFYTADFSRGLPVLRVITMQYEVVRRRG